MAKNIWDIIGDAGAALGRTVGIGNTAPVKAPTAVRPAAAPTAFGQAPQVAQQQRTIPSILAAPQQQQQVPTMFTGTGLTAPVQRSLAPTKDTRVAPDPIGTLFKGVVDSATQVGTGAAQGLNILNGTNDQLAKQRQQDADNLRVNALLAYKNGKINQAKRDDMLRQSSQLLVNDAARQDQVLSDTDPVKNAAAFVNTALNIPAGGAKAGAAVLGQVAEQGLRGLGKVVLKSGAGGAGIGALTGATSALEQGGVNTRPQDILAGAGLGTVGGAVLGGAAPIVGRAAGALGRDAASRGADAIAEARRNPEGGFIRTGVNTPEEDAYIREAVSQYKNPQQFIDDRVDAIYNAEKTGRGVEMVEDGQGGYKRISNNSPFYQAYYDRYGTAPTRKAIKDMVEQVITGKKGEYDNLLTEQEIAGELDPQIHDLLNERDQARTAHDTSAISPEAPAAPIKRTQPDKIADALGLTDADLKRAATVEKERAKTVEIKRQNGEIKFEDIPVTRNGKIKVTGAAKTGEAPAPRASIEPTKDLNVDDYVNEMESRQDYARKGEQGSALDRTKKTAADLKAKFVDSLAPLEDRLAAATSDADKKLVYRDQLDRTLRANTIAHQFAEDNGLHRIIQDVPDSGKLDQYLIAKHTADLDPEIKTGRDANKDAALVKALGPEYEKYASQVVDYTKKMLKTAVDYGLVSKEQAAALRKRYPNYVPINRVFSDEELAGKFTGNGGAPASRGSQTVVQRLRGSSREIESPLGSLLKNTDTLVSQGESNLAARQTAGFRDLPGNPFDLHELPEGQAIAGRPAISYMENGKKRTFLTTPEIEQAAKSLNREQLNIVTQIFAIPTRILRLGATGLSSSFALRNVSKDIQSAFINSKHPWRSSLANPDVFLQALKAAVFHSGAEYKELRRTGAAGNSFDVARNNPKQTVKLIRSQRNVGTTALYTVTHPGALLRAAENTIGRSEDFGRALQYYGNKKAVKLEGRSDAYAKTYAADAARNNLVNFPRAGDYGRVLNAVLPYLNPGIQGSRTLLRNIKERPVQTAAKIAITGFFPTAVVTAWNIADAKRKEAYDNISDYEKEGNIIIVPPNPVQDPKTGKWNVIKIPVSQEIANLNNIVRNGIEAAAGDKGFDFAKMAGDLFGTATSLQAQSPSQLIGQFTPQAVKPFGETASNVNTFTGQQIVPDAQKNLKPEDQYNSGTSLTARTVGKALGASPYQVDNFISTATAGAGQNVLNFSDRLLVAAGKGTDADVRGREPLAGIVAGFYGAKGTTKGAQFFKTVQEVSKDQHLAGANYDQLNSLLESTVDQNGKPMPQTEQSALEKNRILASSPEIAKVLSDTAIKLAAKNHTDPDPLYKLTPAQQNTYYKLQATPYKSDDYNRISDQNADWLKPLGQARSAFFDSQNVAGTSGVKPASGRVQYPNFDDNTQTKLQQASELEAADRAKFIQDNPDVQDAYEKIFQYTNDKREAQGYDPFAAYPKADQSTQSAINTYNSLPKGDGANGKSPTRSAWIKNHPEEWANMQTYYAKTAAWELANNAGKAKYEGEELNQKALKSAYSLGQYDIVKTANPGGGYTYSINPQAAANVKLQSYGRSGGGSGGGGKTSSDYTFRKNALKVAKIASKTVRVSKPRSTRASKFIKSSKGAVKVTGRKSGKLKMTKSSMTV